MRSILAAAAVALVFAGAPAAYSQSEYSASDIVEHFGAAATTEGAAEEGALCGGQPCLAKGQTRAVCIGTASACAAQPAPAPVAPSGFDLLITFELGSDQLTAQAQTNLQEFARALSDPALAGTRFTIEGHTDASGSDDFNRELSERRARSVVQFLTALGVDPARLEAIGRGESAPRDADPLAPINRRVEASLVTN